MEVQRLVDAGLLTKTMAYRVFPDATTFLSFSNRLPGRRLHAEISYDHSRPVGQLFGMCVTEEVDGEEPEVVSVYRHGCLEHLIQTAKGFLCYYASKSRPVVKRKSAVTFRVDDDLREAFDIAVEATGESRAVVLRQLLRFFVGKAPDPRVIG
jgi:hypothetical protein